MLVFRESQITSHGEAGRTTALPLDFIKATGETLYLFPYLFGHIVTVRAVHDGKGT